jgi:hypothetical protein
MGPRRAQSSPQCRSEQARDLSQPQWLLRLCSRHAVMGGGNRCQVGPYVFPQSTALTTATIPGCLGSTVPALKNPTHKIVSKAAVQEKGPGEGTAQKVPPGQEHLSMGTGEQLLLLWLVLRSCQACLKTFSAHIS